LKVPFGNCVAFPNEVPWPGRLKAFMPSWIIRCRTSDESCRQFCPASHTTALGELFIADVRAGVQGGIYGATMFTRLVPVWPRVEEMQVSLRLTGQPRRLSPHKPFLFAGCYGNSRITNFAGFVLMLVTAGKPPGDHLTSPGLTRSGPGAWPSTALPR
jgi:hypothetical protein